MASFSCFENLNKEKTQNSGNKFVRLEPSDLKELSLVGFDAGSIQIGAVEQGIMFGSVTQVSACSCRTRRVS